MSDEIIHYTDADMTAPPPAEVAKEAPETPAVEEVAESLVEDQETEGSEDDGEEEYADYDDEGKKYKVPKALVERLMKDKDYTQKTQSLAEERKAAREEVAKVKEFWETRPKEVATLSAQKELLDAQAEEWKKVNFDLISQEHGEDVASKEYRRMLELDRKRAELAETIKAKTAELDVQSQKDVTERLQKVREHAEKNIPNWSEKVDEDIGKYLKAKGVDLSIWLKQASPELYEVFYDATQGKKLRSAASTKPLAKEPPPPAAPIPPTPNRAPRPTFDAGKASMDDYVAKRRSGWKG